MKLAIALLLSLSAAAPVAPPEETYETSGSYRPSDVVSKELVSGPHHQVQTPVVFDGYMYRFTVRSDYGPFEITGTSHSASSLSRSAPLRSCARSRRARRSPAPSRTRQPDHSDSPRTSS